MSEVLPSYLPPPQRLHARARYDLMPLKDPIQTLSPYGSLLSADKSCCTAAGAEALEWMGPQKRSVLTLLQATGLVGIL